jgi:hypothetical protein
MCASFSDDASRCLKCRRSSLRPSFQLFLLLLVTLVACLPTTGAFSTPATQSALFSSRTRARFIDRRTSVPPTSAIKDVSLRRHAPVVYTRSRSNDHKKLFPDFFPDVEVSTTDKILVTIMTAAMFAAFGWLMQVSGPGAWRYFLAGGICAATSHAITTPIDVVKVRR